MSKDDANRKESLVNLLKVAYEANSENELKKRLLIEYFCCNAPKR